MRTNNAVLDVDLTNPDIQHGETLMLAKDTIHLTRMKFLWNAACYELLVARNFGEQTHTLRIDFDFDARLRRPVRSARLPTARPRQSDRERLAPNVTRFAYASQDGVPAPPKSISIRLPKELHAAARCNSSSSCRRSSAAR